MAVGSDCRPHSNRNANILCLVVWSFINLLLRKDGRRPIGLGFSSSRPLCLLRHLDVLRPLSGLDIGRTSSSCNICAAPSINHAQVQGGTPEAISYSRVPPPPESTRQHSYNNRNHVHWTRQKIGVWLSAPTPAGKARQQVRCKHHFTAQRLSEAHGWEHTHVHKTPPRGHASIWPLLVTPAYLKCLTLQMLRCLCVVSSDWSQKW